MKVALLFLLLLFCNPVKAQQKVETVVPQKSIIAGMAFQVQYVVRDLAHFQTLLPPLYGKDFRLVSGPRVYAGNIWVNGKATPVQNFSVTLLPLRTGKVVIKGATAVYKNGPVQSNNVTIEVKDSNQLFQMPMPAAALVTVDNIRGDVAVQAMVDKKECYTGEPVVATFTLLTRTSVTAEVVKHPSFYGFGMVEMQGLHEKEKVVRTANGTFYNAHTIRQVQLYPTQSGKVNIDAMSVAVTTEGATEPDVITTKPLTLTIKALPGKAPQNFSGAVGVFNVTAAIDADTLQQNSSGKLIVTVSGKGNFLQMPPPEISWPKEVESFEPKVQDQLQQTVPQQGTRRYTYHFMAGKPGYIVIPPVSFVYFNTATKSYKTITTHPLKFWVTPSVNTKAATAVLPAKKETAYGWLPATILVVLLTVAGAVWRNKKVRPQTTQQTPATPDYIAQIESLSSGDNKEGYTQLQHLLLQFFKETYNIKASTKEGIIQQLKKEKASSDAITKLEALLAECQAVQYFQLQPNVPLHQLKSEAVYLIKQTMPA